MLLSTSPSCPPHSPPAEVIAPPTSSITKLMAMAPAGATHISHSHIPLTSHVVSVSQASRPRPLLQKVLPKPTTTSPSLLLRLWTLLRGGAHHLEAHALDSRSRLTLARTPNLNPHASLDPRAACLLFTACCLQNLCQTWVLAILPDEAPWTRSASRDHRHLDQVLLCF